MVENKKHDKICTLYVNQMHLIVMLIPYIEKELEKGNKIVTILENDLREEVGTLVNKVNLPRKKKKGLKAINWNKTRLSFEEIESIKDSKKVINCFELGVFEENSREILENHYKILNTLGEKDISEMFHPNMMKSSILTK